MNLSQMEVGKLTAVINRGFSKTFKDLDFKDNILSAKCMRIVGESKNIPSFLYLDNCIGLNKDKIDWIVESGLWTSVKEPSCKLISGNKEIQ